MHAHRRLLLVYVVAMLAASCGPRPSERPGAVLDPFAERYVKLVLALGVHDADYVDAYYGPPEWREAAKRDSAPLGALRERADSLAAEMVAVSLPAGDTLGAMRHRYLARQVEALVGRLRVLSGEKLSFDEESQVLYDAVAPRRDDSHFAPALATLDSLLPGSGPLHARYEKFREALVIPPDRVDAVFRAALEEARRRTLAHIALPDSETFTIEYVKGQPWSGYNWYQGGSKSLIQVNVDLPIHVDRALDLAAHEGYPGHHLYNALLEGALVRDRGWTEFSVYPLFSPMSLIAEGTAVVATEVAFPEAERRRFERDVLFPLAGIDTALAEPYERVRRAVDRLSGASSENARRYLEGRITREEAIRWAMDHELRTRKRAEQGIRFAERYRSYLINYSHGRDLVREWLERNGGDEAHPERRWELYRELLASPRLPADLRVAPVP